MQHASRIAITSQNFRTVTGHAGKARRFLVYKVGAGATAFDPEQLDLPLAMAMHDFDDRHAHPLDAIDVLITGSCGDALMQRMARRGVRIVVTGETDPETALHAYLAGCLKPPAPHAHAHAQEAEGVACTCHAPHSA